MHKISAKIANILLLSLHGGDHLVAKLASILPKKKKRRETRMRRIRQHTAFKHIRW